MKFYNTSHSVGLETTAYFIYLTPAENKQAHLF